MLEGLCRSAKPCADARHMQVITDRTLHDTLQGRGPNRLAKRPSGVVFPSKDGMQEPVQRTRDLTANPFVVNWSAIDLNTDLNGGVRRAPDVDLLSQQARLFKAPADRLPCSRIRLQSNQVVTAGIAQRLPE